MVVTTLLIVKNLHEFSTAYPIEDPASMSRAVGAGGAMAPPDFGRPAYPISTGKWGSRLSPPNYYLPTRFSDFPTSEAHHSKTSWIDAKILFFDEIRFEMPTSQFIKQVDEVPRI